MDIPPVNSNPLGGLPGIPAKPPATAKPSVNQAAKTPSAGARGLTASIFSETFPTAQLALATNLTSLASHSINSQLIQNAQNAIDPAQLDQEDALHKKGGGGGGGHRRAGGSKRSSEGERATNEGAVRRPNRLQKAADKEGGNIEEEIAEEEGSEINQDEFVGRSAPGVGEEEGDTHPGRAIKDRQGGLMQCGVEPEEEQDNLTARQAGAGNVKTRDLKKIEVRKDTLEEIEEEKIEEEEEASDEDEEGNGDDTQGDSQNESDNPDANETDF